ncbi:MAG: hypothetical protein A6F71_01415 [Cycloclasticus sp. symbiont of Poecilosclerida sp. M]|nr:MAG: hypothetical protein A6F71_01415 [Cycloclasticus sp. symbiont of Poecilosclerida sp. M]
MVLNISRWADEPFSEDAEGGLSARHSSASSTIRGKLNQWMELGGIDEASSSQSLEILDSRRSSRREKNAIWVKVVPVAD